MHSPNWDRLRSAAEQATQQGDFAAAEAQWMAALEEADRFGPQDPRTSFTVDRLADILYRQQKYEEAEPLFKMSLEMRISIHGDRHLDVAASLNNLADMYVSQHRYDEAEPLQMRVLEMYESLFGQEHPGVALITTNLAITYHEQGRLEQAENLYKRAIYIKQKLYGYKHPEVDDVTQRYASLLVAANRNEEAQKLLGEIEGTVSGVWKALTQQKAQDAAKRTWTLPTRKDNTKDK